MPPPLRRSRPWRASLRGWRCSRRRRRESLSSHDPILWGFSSAPKFPHEPELLLLLDQVLRTHDSQTLAAAAEHYLERLKATEKTTWTNDGSMLARLRAFPMSDGRQLGDLAMVAITEDVLKGFHASLVAGGLAASTRNQIRAGHQSVVPVGGAQGLRSSVPDLGGSRTQADEGGATATAPVSRCGNAITDRGGILDARRETSASVALCRGHRNRVPGRGTAGDSMGGRESRARGHPDPRD